ncbi:MAG: capsule biosynthesis protein [Candidatus Adiutrix sp.]|nr:capsule biosynthesis protein [Candidatus Adiutrix sp.]
MKRFLFLTLTPAAAVLFYTAVWASPMYISASRFAIRNLESGGGFGALDVASLFGGASAGSTVGDSYLIANYVHSWDIFSKIDARLDLKAHFSDRRKDLISRLARDSTQTDTLEYWSWVSSIHFDPDTGIITCAVKAYSPEMAWRTNRMIIELCETLINDMNQRGRQDSLALAAAEVKRAEERLAAAHANMRKMRERTTILDPRSAAETMQAIIVKLEVEAAQIAAELNEARAYMREDSPTVESLIRRLEAINAQLATERRKLSESPSGQDPLSAITGQFENLMLEEEFARQQYAAALAALEGARLRTEAKNRYLVAFEPPLRPDESLYPLVIKSTVLTFIGAGLIWSFLSLIVASIREHAGF